ncbi:MAG: hypothetical protein IT181_04455 [Acidobacteria bacterium]|nr:hypothetical protein [Acidobacteriota bacterium]
MSTRVVFVVIALASMLPTGIAQAQNAPGDAVRLPAAFLGAGFGLASNDAASRMRLYETGIPSQWLVEGAVALAPRVSLGLELSRPSAARAFTTVGLGRAQIAGRQDELVLVGLVRLRLAQAGRVAFDVVGGGGILFQHHESGGCVPAQTRCDSTSSGPSLDERAPVIAGGFDLTIRLGRHVEFVPAARLYDLRRGEHTVASEQDFNLTWQFAWMSSTRAALLANARVVW